MELLALRPAALCIIDPSENNLAELVRTMRSGSLPLPPVLQPEPLDYGEPLTHAFLAAQAPFDVVLSFAALKHVRSERDEFSLLRMLDVNLVKADRFLAALRRQGHGRDGVFFVSTDKAADPVSLMGASKRAMELLLWAHTEAGAPASLIDGGNAPPLPRATTTRFANVAFSDGSLPWSFLQRLEKGQSLAAPVDVRRYLVSPVEAGQLCLLAALICPHRRVLVPNLDPARDLVSLSTSPLPRFAIWDWSRRGTTTKLPPVEQWHVNVLPVGIRCCVPHPIQVERRTSKFLSVPTSRQNQWGFSTPRP